MVRYFKTFIICLVFCALLMPFNILAKDKTILTEEDFTPTLETNDSKGFSSDKNGTVMIDENVEIINIKKNTIPTTFISAPENVSQILFIAFIAIVVCIPIIGIAIWFFKLFKVFSDIFEIDGDNTESVITIK